MDEERLFKYLQGTDKQDLLALMRRCFRALDVESRYRVFWQFYESLPPLPVDGMELLKQVKRFDAQSRAGDFYRKIVTTSRNHSQVPKETDDWYEELGLFLEKSMHLTEQGDFANAVASFQTLEALIKDFMENGHEIVFDNQPGPWKIEPHQEAWQKAYAKACKGLKKPAQ